MGRQGATVLCVFAMVALIAGLDVALFRHRLMERLMANVGIVLLFGAFWLRFFRPS